MPRNGVQATRHRVKVGTRAAVSDDEAVFLSPSLSLSVFLFLCLFHFSCLSMTACMSRHLPLCECARVSRVTCDDVMRDAVDVSATFDAFAASVVAQSEDVKVMVTVKLTTSNAAAPSMPVALTCSGCADGTMTIISPAAGSRNTDASGKIEFTVQFTARNVDVKLQATPQGAATFDSSATLTSSFVLWHVSSFLLVTVCASCRAVEVERAWGRGI